MSTTVFAQSTRFSVKPYLNGEAVKRVDYGEVQPGQVLEGQLKISLLDDIKSVFSISAVSLTQFEQAGDVNDWISFENDQKSYELDISQEAKDVLVDYKLSLPDNLSPGEYRIIVRAALTSSEGQGEIKGSAVNVYPAVGFNVLFKIPGEKYYDVKLVQFNYNLEEFEKNNLHYAVKVRNDSNVSIFPVLYIKVMDKNKNILLEEEFEQGKCGSRSGCDHIFRVDNIKITNIENFKANLEVYYKEDKNSEKIFVAKDSVVISLFPWKLVIAIASFLGLIFIATLVLLLRKILLRKKSVVYIVQKGDNLESVSNKFQANPKHIISVNNLKIPYSLQEGQKLLVPKK